MTEEKGGPAGSADAVEGARRPIAARSSSWAIGLAGRLARSAVTPNQISVASMVMALFGALAMLAAPGVGGIGASILYVLAAVFVQLRLICNLLDGMVAIEGGRKSPTGAIYNEVPDRVADSLFLIAAGYAAGVDWLGWAGALAAALTAYIRVFGGAVGLVQDFSGVMAKQRRMAALTGGLVVAAVELPLRGRIDSLVVVLALILAGSLWTCVTRLKGVAAGLEERGLDRK